MTMTKRQQNKLDAAIDEIVTRRLNGVSIGIMDIGKVFTAAYNTFLAGGDAAAIEAAVVARYNELRQN